MSNERIGPGQPDALWDENASAGRGVLVVGELGQAQQYRFGDVMAMVRKSQRPLSSVRIAYDTIGRRAGVLPRVAASMAAPSSADGGYGRDGLPVLVGGARVSG